MEKLFIVVMIVLGGAMVLGAHGKDKRRCEAAGGELGWRCTDKQGNSVRPIP